MTRRSRYERQTGWATLLHCKGIGRARCAVRWRGRWYQLDPIEHAGRLMNPPPPDGMEPLDWASHRRERRADRGWQGPRPVHRSSDGNRAPSIRASLRGCCPVTARCTNPECASFLSWPARRGSRIADARCGCGSPIRKSSGREEHEAAIARVDAQPAPGIEYAYFFKDGDRFFLATDHDLRMLQGVAQGRSDHEPWLRPLPALPAGWKPGDPIPEELIAERNGGKYLRGLS